MSHLTIFTIWMGIGALFYFARDLTYLRDMNEKHGPGVVIVFAIMVLFLWPLELCIHIIGFSIYLLICLLP